MEKATWLTERRRIVGLATDLATMQGVSQVRSEEEGTPLVCQCVLFNDGTEGWLEYPAQLAFGPEAAEVLFPGLKPGGDGGQAGRRPGPAGIERHEDRRAHRAKS